MSKLIPAIVLLVLGIIEAIGGLYFEDKRTKNDFTIELISLAILPTLIQPAIFIVVLYGMTALFPGLENLSGKFLPLAYARLSHLRRSDSVLVA